MPPRKENPGSKIRIGHSPTKRETKGSDHIIKIIESLAVEYPVELVLIEGLGYDEAIQLKSTCNIFVDQLGELGYGVSGLESLAMGIPTLVELKPDFEGFLGDHPFVNVNRDNLAKKITDLVENPEKRKRLGLFGQGWVREKHSPLATAGHIVGRMREKGLLNDQHVSY